MPDPLAVLRGHYAQGLGLLLTADQVAAVQHEITALRHAAAARPGLRHRQRLSLIARRPCRHATAAFPDAGRPPARCPELFGTAPGCRSRWCGACLAREVVDPAPAPGRHSDSNRNDPHHGGH
ncbi:MAG: hypothetical protein ABIL09_04470 [Gemmatimonadota bacterium]